MKAVGGHIFYFIIYFFFPPPKERLQSELDMIRKKRIHRDTCTAIPGGGKSEFMLALEGGYSTPEPQNLGNEHQEFSPSCVLWHLDEAAQCGH